MSNQDISELVHECPNYHCRQQLWKNQITTGNFCFRCGTKVRISRYTEKYENNQKTFEAFIFGFISGFCLAGIIGAFSGHGLLYGTIWGLFWGWVRFSSGSPNCLYNKEYLDHY